MRLNNIQPFNQTWSNCWTRLQLTVGLHHDLHSNSWQIESCSLSQLSDCVDMLLTFVNAPYWSPAEAFTGTWSAMINSISLLTHEKPCWHVKRKDNFVNPRAKVSTWRLPGEVANQKRNSLKPRLQLGNTQQWTFRFDRSRQAGYLERNVDTQLCFPPIRWLDVWWYSENSFQDYDLYVMEHYLSGSQAWFHDGRARWSVVFFGTCLGNCQTEQWHHLPVPSCCVQTARFPHPYHISCWTWSG